jgi:hypothetical protein
VMCGCQAVSRSSSGITRLSFLTIIGFRNTEIRISVSAYLPA